MGHVRNILRKFRFRSMGGYFRYYIIWRGSYIFSYIYGKIRGVDFTMENGNAVWHKGTPTPWLGMWNLRVYLKKELKKELPSGDENRMIDIGCGKGKMLAFFSRFDGFAQVCGIEHEPKLEAAARRNLAHLKLDHAVSVIRGDAGNFDGYDRFNWFYLYNPFSGEGMARFLACLRESLARKPRKIRLIYVNPTRHEDLAAFGFLLEKQFYYRTNVYVYKKHTLR